MAALHQVCLENTLFLPSFPISDMSDLEIEKAAMGPRRWIELCSALQKQDHNDNGVTLRPRATRSFNVSNDLNAGVGLFIVPGGRYLVSHSRKSISVWDLGYTSSSDCKLIASVERKVKYKKFMVYATPDGMGLIIFSKTIPKTING